MFADSSEVPPPDRPGRAQNVASALNVPPVLASLYTRYARCRRNRPGKLRDSNE